MGTSLQQPIADYLIACTNVLTANPKVFILLGTEVVELMHEEDKDGSISCWLERCVVRGCSQARPPAVGCLPHLPSFRQAM